MTKKHLRGSPPAVKLVSGTVAIACGTVSTAAQTDEESPPEHTGDSFRSSKPSAAIPHRRWEESRAVLLGYQPRGHQQP